MESGERFDELLEEIKALRKKKGEDYGSDEDTFANCRSATEYGIPPWVGTAIRMGDKMHRIKQASRRGSLSNESLIDSLMDLAVYSLIAIVLLEEEK